MSLRGRVVENPADQNVIDKVARYGHMVLKISDREDDPTDQPAFAYSVGAFESYGAPELIVFGLDLDDAAIIINDVMADYVAGRRFACGVPERGLMGDDYPVVFHEADPEGAKAFAAFADWYYERASFPLWQLVWSANNGCFPWDGECPAEVRRAQIDMTGGRHWNFLR